MSTSAARPQPREFGVSLQIPKGWKQSECGFVPLGWEFKPLGHIATITAGGTPSRSVAAYWNGSIPWITTTEVNFCKIESAEQFISQQGLDNSAAKLLPPGTLLIALYGQGKTRGKVAVLTIRAATNQACAAISLREGQSSDFVFHYLRDRYHFIRSLSNTGNQENLNSALVRSIPIALPTLVEQTAIAEALSDADALIESLAQLIAKKRAIKQGAMQELLTGKRRLLGFQDEWGTTTLEECSAFITKGSTPTTYGFSWEQSGILFLRSECVSPRGLDLSESMFISAQAHSMLKRSEVNASDILMTITGNVGRVVQLPVQFESSNINQHIARIRITAPQMLNTFVAQMLSQESFRRYYASILTGQAYPQISLQQVRETKILAPSLKEQIAIASALSDMDTEIEELGGKLSKARQVKQGMMQELLTGRVRLI